MDVTFIVNMRAGNFKGLRVWRQLEQQLTIPYTLHETKYAGHAKEITEQLALQSHKQLVIAIGGDGTMHEVVNGANRVSHLILGYVKGGSGNDFARGFTYFEDAKAIEAFVKEPHTCLVDSGRIIFNDTQMLYFINNFGIGFDAFVSELANGSKVKKIFNKLRLGKLSYAYFVVQALMQFKPFTLHIEGEESRVFEQVWFATVSNQPYFGGGMKISPTSRIDDEILEVTVVNNLSRMKFLFLFLTVFKGKHTKFKEVTQFQLRETTLIVDNFLPIHTDGENTSLTQQTVFCTVEPASITIAK